MTLSTTIGTSDNKLINAREVFQLFPFNILQQTMTCLFACGHPSIKSPEDAVRLLFPNHCHYLRRKFKHKIVHNEVTQEGLDVAADFG